MFLSIKARSSYAVMLTAILLSDACKILIGQPVESVYKRDFRLIEKHTWSRCIECVMRICFASDFFFSFALHCALMRFFESHISDALNQYEQKHVASDLTSARDLTHSFFYKLDSFLMGLWITQDLPFYKLLNSCNALKICKNICDLCFQTSNLTDRSSGVWGEVIEGLHLLYSTCYTWLMKLNLGKAFYFSLSKFSLSWPIRIWIILSVQ